MVGEKISEMEGSDLGELTSFLRPHTNTLHSGRQKNIRDGRFSFGGVYIISASTHTLYIVVGKKILEMCQTQLVKLSKLRR